MEVKHATKKSYAYVVVSAKEYAEIKAKALKALNVSVQNTRQNILRDDQSTTIR
jgi:hypothetical protein